MNNTGTASASIYPSKSQLNDNTTAGGSVTTASIGRIRLMFSAEDGKWADSDAQ